MTGLLLFSNVHFNSRIISMQIEKDSQKPKHNSKMIKKSFLEMKLRKGSTQVNFVFSKHYFFSVEKQYKLSSRLPINKMLAVEFIKGVENVSPMFKDPLNNSKPSEGLINL